MLDYLIYLTTFIVGFFAGLIMMYMLTYKSGGMNSNNINEFNKQEY